MAESRLSETRRSSSGGAAASALSKVTSRFRSSARSVGLSGLDSISGLGVERRPAIILEIGTAYTKCGFAEEGTPRHIVPTSVEINGKPCKVFDLEEQRSKEELREILVHFLYKILYQRLLVNTKDRRILVSESLMGTTKYRSVLADILYRHYFFASVLFAPTSLFALLPCGSESALVVDCGYAECSVIAVYEGTPLIGTLQTVQNASKLIHDTIKAKLQAMNVPEEDLADEKTLEDIKVRACFVKPKGGNLNIPTFTYRFPSGYAVELDSEFRTSVCEVLFEGFDIDDESISGAILDSILRCQIDIRKEIASKILLCGGTCMIPGFRKRIAQELLELVNEKRYSKLKGSMAKRCVLQIELSTSGEKIDSLTLDGDRNRLIDEITSKLPKCHISESEMNESEGEKVDCTVITHGDPNEDELKGALSVGQRTYVISQVKKREESYSTGVKFALFAKDFPSNYMSWLGASMFGALETFSDRSTQREAYLKLGSLPDWCTAATLSD
eukprot:m.51136 g.51136  ORF g.51136 m.51136 type:complete len:503 (+) comp10712_c0_seq1:188-1696(+)